MHLSRRHAVHLLLLASVAAANAFVPKRRHMRYLTDAFARPSIESNQSLRNRRDVSFPFSSLQLRGGSVDEEITGQIASGEKKIVETTEDSETPKAERVWEEEIKRTQSFYQAQSVNASETIDDSRNDVEDLRGYGSSQTLTAQSNPKVVAITDEGDESDPAQANEGNVDIVEAKDDTEDNDTVEVDTDNKCYEEVFEEVTEEEKEAVAEGESLEEVLEKEEIAEDEALQVEVVAEEPMPVRGGVENVDAEDMSMLEDVEGNYAMEVSDEVAREEVIEEEEILEEEIVAQAGVLERDIVPEDSAIEEDTSNEGVVDSSVTQLGDDDEEEVHDDVAEGDAGAADESSEYTPAQDPNVSTVALKNDEPFSLLRKVSDLLQVMLLRGRIAVSKNKGIQYIAQHKPKMKVIALASLGGLMIFLRAEGQTMQEAETLELPNDLIEEESYIDEPDGDE
jgi:hypothetical protein